MFADTDREGKYFFQHSLALKIESNGLNIEFPWYTLHRISEINEKRKRALRGLASMGEHMARLRRGAMRLNDGMARLRRSGMFMGENMARL